MKATMHLFFQNDRPAPDLSLQPCVNPIHWRILRRPTGTLHITAQLAAGPLRLTSALVAIDLSRGLVKTESRRSYSLSVPPEQDQLVQALCPLGNESGIGLLFSSESFAEIRRRLWGSLPSHL
jgi:hypothetical protein